MSDVEKGYDGHYSDDGFWGKLKEYAVSAGCEVITQALKLYYVVKLGKAPAKIKAIILGALGYFILPIDAIPDLLPGIGYTDDLGVLAAAIAIAAAHIDEEVISRATEQAKEWGCS